MTEDYVSFETAKLLKEKGFDIPLSYYYNSDGRKGYATSYNWNQTTGDFPDYSCPTLQMAMKWLREIHNIFIEISVDEMLKDEGYQWALYYNSTKEIRPYSGWGDSYEEACEAAIKYCLENLI